MRKIRVLLAEDHVLVRKGLRSLLENQPDIEVVAEADDGGQALQLASQLEPDVVLMDLTMPGLNGLEAARQIRAGSSQARVLVLTRHASQEYAERAWQAGVSGYLVKRSAPEELILAIRVVYKGGIYLDPALANSFGALEVSSDRYEQLTSREREVLQLIAEGRANREIAARLGVSVKTVDNHRAHLLKKLGVRSTAELTQIAIRQGLITLDE